MSASLNCFPNERVCFHLRCYDDESSSLSTVANNACCIFCRCSLCGRFFELVTCCHRRRVFSSLADRTCRLLPPTPCLFVACCQKLSLAAVVFALLDTHTNIFGRTHFCKMIKFSEWILSSASREKLLFYLEFFRLAAYSVLTNFPSFSVCRTPIFPIYTAALFVLGFSPFSACPTHSKILSFAPLLHVQLISEFPVSPCPLGHDLSIHSSQLSPQKCRNYVYL